MRRRGPTVGYSRPATWDETSTPMACGNVVSPDSSAVSPRRSCRNSGMRNSTPAKLEYDSSEARLALRNIRSAKQPQGQHRVRLAQLDPREQRERDACRPTAAPTTTCGDRQPLIGPSDSA